ncbi:MAG: type III secretion system export apparatus subunit SctS [Myxococcaceae bacterium]|nr:type III secretion system export apparatus subunit SctS [Myxococcaceae bacterium]MBH2005932.1 type III secretion system export apparatus subunit SctS [Myxococcaceae bacterium]
MNVAAYVAQMTNEAILLTILISAPSIVASLVIGLAVALFSAVTQIQEQTLSFAPKMVFVYVAMAVSGSWIGGLMIRFATKCLSEFANMPLG